jgi:hypothetical protein
LSANFVAPYTSSVFRGTRFDQEAIRASSARKQSATRARIGSRLSHPFDTAEEIEKMLAYDYPLLGVFWSLLLLFMFVMVGFVVVYTFVDNFRRSDHSGAAKAGWALLIIVLPLLGALIYILTRPEMTNPPLRPAV